MKNYLGLLAILIIAVGNVQTVSAREDKISSETSAGTGNTITSAQKRANLEAKMKAQADLKKRREKAEAEIKQKREAMKGEIEVKKAKIKAEIKTKRETIHAEIKATRQEAKKEMEQLKAKIKEEKDVIKAEIKQTRITGRENALKRFDAKVLRISELKDKVNAQIVKLEAKGVDVSATEDFTETAETKLSDIKAKIAEANAILSNSIDKLTTENKTALRTIIKDIETLLNEARKSLSAGIKSLKEVVKIKMGTEESTL